MSDKGKAGSCLGCGKGKGKAGPCLGHGKQSGERPHEKWGAHGLTALVVACYSADVAAAQVALPEVAADYSLCQVGASACIALALAFTAHAGWGLSQDQVYRRLRQLRRIATLVRKAGHPVLTPGHVCSAGLLDDRHRPALEKLFRP